MAIGDPGDAVAIAELERLLGVWCNCAPKSWVFISPRFRLPCPLHNLRELATSIRSAIGDMAALRQKLDDPMSCVTTQEIIDTLIEHKDVDKILQALNESRADTGSI